MGLFGKRDRRIEEQLRDARHEPPAELVDGIVRMVSGSQAAAPGPREVRARGGAHACLPRRVRLVRRSRVCDRSCVEGGFRRVEESGRVRLEVWFDAGNGNNSNNGNDRDDKNRGRDHDDDDDDHGPAWHQYGRTG